MLIGCRTYEQCRVCTSAEVRTCHGNFPSACVTGRRAAPVNGAHATHQQANTRAGAAAQFQQWCTTLHAERSVTFNEEDNEAGRFESLAACFDCDRFGSRHVLWCQVVAGSNAARRRVLHGRAANKVMQMLSDPRCRSPPGQRSQRRCSGSDLGVFVDIWLLQLTHQSAGCAWLSVAGSSLKP